jgi:hypothetical protein
MEFRLLLVFLDGTLFPAVLPKAAGHTDTNKARMPGIQAQMIPTSTSTVDHVAIGMKSSVESVRLEEKLVGSNTDL